MIFFALFLLFPLFFLLVRRLLLCPLLLFFLLPSVLLLNRRLEPFAFGLPDVMFYDS